jgi:hypothetical protein
MWARCIMLKQLLHLLTERNDFAENVFYQKFNTELSQIVLAVKSLLFIYEHMAFVIFVSLNYLHILHSFTFPHFCQMTELHICCFSKCLSILCVTLFPLGIPWSNYWHFCFAIRPYCMCNCSPH